MQSEPNKTITKKYGSYSTLESNLGFSTDRLDSSHITSSYEQIFNPKEFSPIRKISRNQNSDAGPGLSQILSAPSNFIPKSISNKFKSVSEVGICDKIGVIEKKSDNLNASCVDCNIEQGLDMLDPTHNLICTSQNEHSLHENLNDLASIQVDKMQRRISRSVGSYTDDEKMDNNLEVGSDPLLRGSIPNPGSNFSDQSLPNSLGEGRKEFLQRWFNNSEHICSEENLCHEVLGTEQDGGSDSSLTIRTEALVAETSTFHLVKPKH